MKSDFEKWLRLNAIKKDGSKYSDSTIYKYTSSIDVIEKEFNISLWKFESVDNLLNNKTLLFNNKAFIDKNVKGNNMYSRAVEIYIEYICDCNINSLEKDIKIIENDKTLSLEEKNGYIETICNIRNPEFQRNFRNELIKEFNGQCALCQINDKRLLIASHIVPYSECRIKSDMYKSHNGLLLCVLHDALFDKKMISFNNEGKIIISHTIDQHLYDFLNIDEKMCILKKYITDERKEFLKEHLANLYKYDNE